MDMRNLSPIVKALPMCCRPWHSRLMMHLSTTFVAGDELQVHINPKAALHIGGNGEHCLLNVHFVGAVSRRLLLLLSANHQAHSGSPSSPLSVPDTLPLVQDELTRSPAGDHDHYP